MGAYVDLHLHLLPDVDDGARSIDDALLMARALLRLGFSRAAPSPHNQPHFAPRALCLARLQVLRGALAEAQLALELFPNAENQFVDPLLLVEGPGPQGRRLGDTRAMLIEAPYATPLPSVADLVFRLRLKGVVPVIAHPERCMEFERPGRAAELARAGALLQLDLGALTGRYGEKAKRLSHAFLGEGLYAVAATDLHSPSGAEQWVGDAMRQLEKLAGAGALARLLAENPARLLAGEPLLELPNA